MARKTLREALFEEAVRKDWDPQFRDGVYLPKRSPFKLRATGFVSKRLDLGYLEITQYYGGRFIKNVIHRSEVRPTGERLEYRGGVAVWVDRDGRVSRAGWQG